MSKSKVAFSTILIVVAAMTAINLLFDLSIHVPQTADELIRVACARIGSGLTTALSAWLIMNPEIAKILRGAGFEVEKFGDEVAEVFLALGCFK